ncbi:MAG: M20/M25/M40 family metallo-hydrolase [Bryobacteraceae bacterium]|jgi:hypothetical protein
MNLSRQLVAIAAGLSFSAGFALADQKAVNPRVREIVDAVSEARIQAIIEKLESFGTRHTMSNPDDPVRGIGAARQWIFNEFKSYSPRLQVRFDQYRVKRQGQRIFKDVDLYNVIAVLPGTRMPETQILISGHYDSLNLGNRPAGGALAGSAGQPAQTQADYEKNAELPAPGACDDGSGTAAVMELARVMSRYEFPKTLVFVAFAGEEQGLIGSSLLAAKARKEAQVIEAVLNNDIIGTEVAGNGRTGNSEVSVYSDETQDSPSQQLARFAREIGERYLPSMNVSTIFMEDRLGRGGDQTPFQWEGYAAVRFSTPNEIYANQHHAADTLANMSVPYTTRVARINAAVAASLALAPKPPIVTREPRSGAPAANRRPGPMISRGSGYDAVLQWRTAGPDADIQGYAIVIRLTTAPYWKREIYVGKVNQYTLKDVSIDDARFGVKAIGADGAESLVTPYVYPPRQKTEIQVVP